MTLCCAHDHDGGAGGGSGAAQALMDRHADLSLHPSPSLARQSGGAVLAVIAGLLVVAASTLAIRMARQVEEDATAAGDQVHVQRIRTALRLCRKPGQLPVQPMARRTQGWRCHSSGGSDARTATVQCLGQPGFGR